MIHAWRIPCEMSLNHIDDKSTLGAMTWFHQATSHYLTKCCPSSILSCVGTRPQLEQLEHLHSENTPWLIITLVREVIMFSPCVFVCLCLCHNVCPEDVTMQDWCRTNNILQVHCWGCLVVQVVFHALMTSLMTSPSPKVGQSLKLIYLRQYLS